MTDSYKLVIKLPTGGEFSGEGDKEAVREDYERFLEALKCLPIQAPPPLPVAPPTEATPNFRTYSDGNTVLTVAEGGVDRAVMERLFSVDRTGTVSLRALPRSENKHAEALMALLYGHQVLRGEHSVTSGRLMKDARQSGIQVDRIDRILNTQSSFVTAAGFKKGRRYGLNNPGAKRAEEILTEILG